MFIFSLSLAPLWSSSYNRSVSANQRRDSRPPVYSVTRSCTFMHIYKHIWCLMHAVMGRSLEKHELLESTTPAGNTKQWRKTQKEKNMSVCFTSMHGGPIKSSLLENISEKWLQTNEHSHTERERERRELWTPAHASAEVIFGLSCLYAYSYPNHKYPSIHN